MDDEESNDCKNRSTDASSDEVTPNIIGSLVRSSMELSINESHTVGNSSEMLTNVHRFAGDEVLLPPAAGPFRSFSTLDNTFQISESLSISSFYNNQAQQQFQGVNDNPRDWVRDDPPTPALYQDDHYLPDLQIGLQIPENYTRHEPVEPRQVCGKMNQYADGHKEEFLHPSVCKPLDSGKRSRAFSCEICGKEFGLNNLLKRHMRIHTGEKPYKCYECSHETSRKDHLRSHIHRTHRKVI